MDKNILLGKYRLLGSKLLKNKRLFQLHYIKYCMKIIEESKDPDNDGRSAILAVLIELNKQRKDGYKEAMNVVAACLALFQEHHNGKEDENKV